MHRKDMIALVDEAKALAHRAHAGQVDKAGRPYIEHVARVAAAVTGDPEAEAVAWLHDVLEDAPEFNEEFWSFPAAVTRQVHYLTRVPGQDAPSYYKRICEHPIALQVKLADIADNSSETRLQLLDPSTAARLRRKYARALLAQGKLQHRTG
ncbi:phosphohydrolase [Xanthomonas euvesicatoria]|uniref:phosphohydrolase n=1 Tax=Xanthomonas euvesicatoria TaxID=456327 RepID=UPI001C0C0BB8|nr:phosphohydrolase [Xanthomonas euvesicatoria]